MMNNSEKVHVCAWGSLTVREECGLLLLPLPDRAPCGEPFRVARPSKYENTPGEKKPLGAC